MPEWCAPDGSDVVIRVKVVPGASRSAISGLLGDRLKVRVAAPPEGGKANAAVCDLLAKALGVAAKSVSVDAGPTNPEKTIRVRGATLDAVHALADA